MANDDVMTWFPRAEDYEVQQTVQPDETTAEKIQRLNDAIELSQTAIKEVVDGNEVCLEHKVYRAMDTVQDLDDFAKLLKECEEEDARGKKENAEALKKARVGIMNLKAYMGQVNVEEFAAAIRNENQFKVGCEQGLGPWLSWTERRMSAPPNKPKDFQEAVKCEEDACKFLKEVVKGNKALKTVQGACDGIRGNVEAQDRMASMQERYYLLCKKAEQRVKNITHLLNEWKRLEDFLAPEEPKDWDDYTPKQMVVFLRTYALYFA